MKLMNVVSNMQVPEAFKGDILERDEKGKNHVPSIRV